MHCCKDKEDSIGKVSECRPAGHLGDAEMPLHQHVWDSECSKARCTKVKAVCNLWVEGEGES